MDMERMFRNLTRKTITAYLKRSLSNVAHAVDARDAGGAKPFSEIPKIPGLPVIGSAWMYLPLVGRYDIRDINHAAWDIHRRYGPIVVEQLPGRRVLVHLFKADDIRTLYQEEGRTPYRAGALPLKLYHELRRDRYFANNGLTNSYDSGHPFVILTRHYGFTRRVCISYMVLDCAQELYGFHLAGPPVQRSTFL